MFILGISCYYHDSAAVLIKDGKLIAAAEEERFSRKKHDSGFPENAIRFVLECGKIKPADLDYVVFYEKPFLKFERILKTTLSNFPKSSSVFRESMITWLLDKLWIKEKIRKKLQIDDRKILFSEHHLSHAASSYYCSPFDEATIVTLDGVGEWATASIGIGKNNKIKILKEIYFPHSLGLLYSAFTAFLGFEINDGEYKVMGMAPYGKPRYVDKVKKLIKLYSDGSFELNMDYFEFHRSTKNTYNKKFIEIFGKPRNPETKFFTSTTPYPSYFGEKPSNYEEMCKENQYYADIASSIQSVLEEAIINLVNAAYRETGIEKLCVGGGVSLNSVANYKILQNTPFKQIYIQPAATDAGGALGAALYAYNQFSNNSKKFILEHAFWGKSYSNSEIRKFLDTNNISYRYEENDEKIIEIVVDALSKGKVVGWFQGRFEWGPRALGNRSILADARRQDMKDIVNTKIKFREPYRPFAPSVLIEKTEEYFDIKEPEKHYPTRFMLYVVDVKGNKQNIIPAVTHVDGSGRLQTVSKETNPRYYELIKKFEEATGVPVILNTSFNLKGEPIVNSPEDAFKTFSKSEMDMLVLENFILEKNHSDKL